MLRKKFPAASFTGTTVLSESGFDLLNRLLTYDPEMVFLVKLVLYNLQVRRCCPYLSISFFHMQRITADEALEHDWFCEVPLPTSKDFMPTFPPLHTVVR